MSPPRRPRAGKKHRITPEVVSAFIERDWRRLHRALGLDYGHSSPLLRSEGGAYGIPLEPEPPGERIILGTRDAALELRRQILEAIAEGSP